MTRVIEHGLVQHEASAAGLAERYRRGETSHTVHVWWARRPHCAMRALVYASLVAVAENQPAALLAELGQPGGIAPDLVASARRNVARSFAGGRPKVLDLFAGGGTIPLEALRLGAETYALDSNQLAAFINSCNLGWAARQEPEALAGLVRAAGQRVLACLARRTAHLFPLRGGHNSLPHRLPITTYLWSYRIDCRRCGAPIWLGKRPWLSKKHGRRLAVEYRAEADGWAVSVGSMSGGREPASGHWIARSGAVRCPRCGWESGKVTLDACRDQLVALVGYQRGHRKQFCAAMPVAVPDAALIAETERHCLDALAQPLPESALPKWTGIVNPAVHGMKTYAQVLNPRQRAVLLALLVALRDQFLVLEAELGTQTATGVISLLSGLVDQCVDWNCRLSMWIPQNEQVGRGFCGPGVSMLWDYAETDPVSHGPSNLWAKLDRIVSGAGAIAGMGASATVVHGYAQDLPFENDYFDAVVTDPPYYDNVYYTVLADFFFVWKRMLFGALRPALFAEATTDATRELVASRYRDGDRAHERYCAQLAAALAEVARTLKPEGVLSMVYSHASLAGWEALVAAFGHSPLAVIGVEPLAIERRQRPRAMTSRAVNTCMVFVARKRARAEPGGCDRETLIQAMERAINSDLGPALEAAGWAEDDLGLALFAQAVGVLCNANGLTRESRRALLVVAEASVQQRYGRFRLARRRSL